MNPLNLTSLRLGGLATAAALVLASLAALPATAFTVHTSRDGPVDPPIIGCGGDPCPDLVPCPPGPTGSGIGDDRVVCSYPCPAYDSDPSTDQLGSYLVLAGFLGTDACAEECTYYYDYETGEYRSQDGYVVHTAAGPVNACYEQTCHDRDYSYVPYDRTGPGVMVNGQPYCAFQCGYYPSEPWVPRDGYTITTPFVAEDACYETQCRHFDTYPSYTKPGIGITLNGQAYCAEECGTYSYDPYADQDGYTLVTPFTNPQPACYEQGCRYPTGWYPYSAKSDGIGITINEQPYCAEPCGANPYDPYTDQDGYTYAAPILGTVSACYEQGCRYPTYTWPPSEKTDGVGLTLNGQAYCVESCPDSQNGGVVVTPSVSVPACSDTAPLVQTVLDLAALAQQTVLDLVGDAQDIVDGATNDPPCEPGGTPVGPTCVGPVQPCEEGLGYHLGVTDACVDDFEVGRCDPNVPPATLGVIVGPVAACEPTPVVGLCDSTHVGATVNGQGACVPVPTVTDCPAGFVGKVVNGQSYCVPLPGPCDPGETGATIGGTQACVPTPGPCSTGVGVQMGSTAACAVPCSGSGEVGAEVGPNRFCQTPPDVSVCEPPRIGVVVGPIRLCL